MTRHFAWLPKKVYDLNDGKYKKIWFKRYYRSLDYMHGEWLYSYFIPNDMNRIGIDKKIDEQGYA